MNSILATLVVSFAAASFFWLRGIWKNARSDCALGLLFLAFSCLAALALGGSTCLLNDVGLAIMALGVATVVVGRARRRTASNQAASWDALGSMFFMFGLFLLLLL
jgi:hypothetical protein